MLEIITSTGVSLDLPSDIQIDITIENPLMYSDKIPTPYSLGVDLPATIKNLKIFGNPHLVTSNSIVKALDVDILFNGITFFTGVMSLGDVKNRSIGSTIEGILLNGVYDKTLNTFAMEEFTFDRSTPYFNSNINNLLTSSVLGNENFITAPVRDISVKWEQVDAHPNIMMQRYLTTGRNYYDVESDNFAHTDKNNFTMLPEITPLIRASYLLDMLCGGLVGENPYSDGELSKLILIPKRKPYNTDSIYGMMRIGSTDKYILSLSRFLSTESAGDVLKDLLKLVCASIVPIGRKFNIKYNKDIINDNEITDWSSILEKEYTLTCEEPMRYKWGCSSNRSSKDGDELIDAIEVESAKAMSDYPNADSKEKLFKITKTKEVYSRKYIDNEPFFTIKDAGIVDKEQDGTFEYDATCSLKAVECNLEKYLISKYSYFWNHWLIPTVDYTEGKDDEDMYLGIYHGYVDTFEAGKKYPFVSSHNYDMFGNKLCELSLSSLKDGVLATYHIDFANWLAKPKVVIRSKVNLDVLGLRGFNVCKKVHCLGRDFYIRKITMHIAQRTINPSDVELIEA